MGHSIMVESMPAPVIEVLLWFMTMMPTYLPGPMYQLVPWGIEANNAVAFVLVRRVVPALFLREMVPPLIET